MSSWIESAASASSLCAVPTQSRRGGFRRASPSTKSRSGGVHRLPIATMLRSCMPHKIPRAMPFVYDFDDSAAGGRELLGGKGAGLAEMTQLGVPVPRGFTITTDACRAFMASGGELPDGLEAEVEEHLHRLEQKTGKRFGSQDDPLLVSVRSGAAVSMPG